MTSLLLPLLGWTIANLFVLALTCRLGRLLRVGSRVDPLIYGWLFLFLTTGLVMICGLAGMLRPWPIFSLSVAGLVVLGWRERAGLAALPKRWRSLKRRAAAWRRGTFGERLADGVFAVFVVFLTVRFAVHIWYLPPYVWDALSYHLPNVAEWVRAGRLVIFDTPVDRTFWPAGYELFQTWFVVFPHHDVLIDAASIPFYLLASASVGVIARQLGLTVRASAWAALAYALTPAPLQHATTGNNDLPTAATYLFLLALLLDARQRRDAPRRRMLVVVLALGLAFGTKASILFLLPGLAVAAVLAVHGPSWREAWSAERWGDSARTLAAALLATATLLAGYWYVRNALVFGNPFYPAEPRIFGKYFFGGDAEGRARQGVLLSGDALVENMSQLVRHRIFDRGPFTYSLKDMAGWGWLVFCCGGPALLWGLIGSGRRRELRWLALIFGLSLAGLLSSVVPDPWNLRFALWFPALPVLAVAAVTSELRDPLSRRALASVALVCLLLNAVGTLDMGRLPPWMWQRMASFPVLERSTAALGLFMGRNYFDALQTIPPGEPIGYNTNYNGWIYPLYGPDLSHAARYVPIGPQTDVVLAMRQREVRYLFISLPPPGVRLRIDAEVARGRLREVGKELYVTNDALSP